ncbi:MAG TPA: hypothetical protein VK034_18595 [Enhygromyxa sp.]|nr:hypothetical protein [Enhygromyxa sp.]
MIAIFGLKPGVLIGLVLLFALLLAAAIGLENEHTLARLRRFAWYRRFERWRPTELRYRGMITLGVGVCCFAALLTLQLFKPVPMWMAMALGIMAVVAVTLGAALLERAGG